MGKLPVGLQLAVIFMVLLVADARKLYPDWSCYPNLSQMWHEYVSEMCKDGIGPCDKSCVFRFHGIVNFDNLNTLESEDKMVEHLNRLSFHIVGDNESITKMARKAIADCGHLSSNATDTHCLPELEECLDKATAC